jgi:RHS repeat-associated protein
VKFKNATSDGQTVKIVDYVTLKAFAGTTATYTFNYTQKTTERHCLSDREAYAGTVSVPMLTSVTLPDGSLWEMDYFLDESFPAPSCRMGSVKSVELPTLGRVEYDYIDWHLPVGTCPVSPLIGNLDSYDVYASASPGVGTRKMITAAGATAATWTYSPALSPQPARPPGWCPAHLWPLPGNEELTVTVTDPLGDLTKHYFSVWPEMFYTSANGFVRTEHGLPFTHKQSDGANPARYLSQQVFDCDAGGTNCSPVRRSEYVRYERDPGTCGEQGNGKCTKANWRVASTRTIHNHDGNRHATVDHSNFDGLGHYRQSTTTGSFDSGNDRSTFTNYNSARGTYPGPFTMVPVANTLVLNTFTDQSVTEGGVTAKSEYCFDTATAPTSANGFLLRKRTYGGSIPGATDIVTRYSPDATGNVQTEEWFGGDSQGLPTTALCTVSLPTRQYAIDNVYQFGSLKTSQHAGAGFLDVDNAIDSSTGLVATSRDSATVATDYEYDNMGRLERIKPAQDAWTRYVYTKAVSSATLASATLRRYPNGAGTGQLTDEQVLFDDFGRVVKERRRMPGGSWSKRSTIYDAVGHKTDVSQWEPDSAGHVGWNKLRNFDPFGRPTTLIPPEGTSHQTTLAYTGVRLVDRTVRIATQAGGVENDSKTTETYDRQGRLYRVTEPSGAAGANVSTTYGYDEGSRLTSVVTSGSTQNRTFAYDNRGFLTSECHPEKGTPGSATGCVGFSNLDARGHARRKTDGPSDLVLAFDAAERLSQITEFGSSNPLKVFSYGTGTAGADRSRGKLKTAERYNYVVLAGTPYKVKIKETYTYGGDMGRVSSKVSENFTAATVNPLPTIPNESFTQAWTAYNDLGAVTSMTYPACTHAACIGAPAVGRAVTFGYGDGRLTSVPGFASSVSYHPNGMTNVVTHGNAVAVTQAKDSYSNLRPLSITSTGVMPPANNWATGAYSYDGVGNVKAIGTSTFLYDKVSRLVSANVFDGLTGGGALRSQNYTFDSFGNLQSLGSLATPTSGTKNRLNSGTYDLAGNLTAWNGQTYEYGPFNELKHFCATTPCQSGGGGDWIYLYTADNERIWAFNAAGGSGRWTLRDLDGKVLREFGSSPWSITEDYIYRDGQLLAGAQTGRYFHPDHLGSPRLVTGAGAIKLAYHVYLPFGEEMTPISQDATRLKFTGHERDLGNSGSNADDLDYMHARFNSPITGRMLSVDPVIGTFNIPQSWNRYAYVTGNPLRYTDPTGQLPAYALAEIAQRYFGELREEAMSALSTGSLAGVIAATLAGSTLDAASALAEPLRAGEAIGTAVGSGAGAGEMALAVGQDSLRAAGLVAPLAGAGRSAVARTGAGFIDDAARVPVGSLRHPMSVVGRPNIPGTIGGRKYTGHALDQMQGRGIPPSVVEDTLARGTRTPGRGGAMVFTTNQARVVVNPNGSIKTVMGQ